MMLRPATPLTILFFVAFVLLVLATISTPIVKAIPLASVNGVDFGVFGYCGTSGCSKIQIGYSVDAKTLAGDPNDSSNFSLPGNTRSSLSAILVVHPVAALLTLICFVLSATAHLHSPSHSPRYLLALLIVSIPTLLVTLLAFLVDILLFIPHLAWGGWIVLVATILILASAIVTCAMRRTLVSRKARKKRIAENAEMNGENFYARQNPQPMGVRADSPPPLVSGAIGASDKLPTFATLEKKSSSGDEDQIPLNTRTPSNKTLRTVPTNGTEYSDDGVSSRYAGPGRGGGLVMRDSRRGNGAPMDGYGSHVMGANAFGPSSPAGMRRDRSEPARLRHQYSDENMNSGRGRGRGGFPSRGHNRGRPYGPGNGAYGRGNIPMGAIAAGTGVHVRRQGQGPPPPGYGDAYPPLPPAQYDGPGPLRYDRSPSATGYGRRPSPGPPSAFVGYGRRPSPGLPPAQGGYDRGPPPGPPPAPDVYGPANHGSDIDIVRTAPLNATYGAESPPQLDGGPIIGQAVEMDARHGSPSLSPNPNHTRPMQLRDSDSDVHGFVGLQQPPKHRDSPQNTMTSAYSTQEPYVPPRAAWTNIAVTRGMTPPPNTTILDPLAVEDPVELPTQNWLSKARSGLIPEAHARKISSNDYYEDVDPRFATSPTIGETRHSTQNTQHTQSSATMPSALMPGLSNTPKAVVGHSVIEYQGEIVDLRSGSYEDIADGQRSPASDNSNMTSISQRGINPSWIPGPRLGVPERRAVQRQRDVLLDSNPNFGIPSQRERGGSGSMMALPAMRGQQGQAF